MNLLDTIETYLTKCAHTKKLESLTLKAYRIDLMQFYDFVCTAGTMSVDSPNQLVESTMPQCSLQQVDKWMVQQFIDTVSTQYLPRSLRRKLASLKAFFSHLEFEDIIQVSPFRKIKTAIKIPKQIPKALSLFDMEKILDFLYKKDCTKLQNLCTIAIIELLFATGIRVSELCNIHLNDFDTSTHTLIIKGKGNAERLTTLNNTSVINILHSYLDKRPDIAPHFLFLNRRNQPLSTQSVRLTIKHIGKTVLQKKVTPHMLRHTFATLLLEEGVDITHIKSFLGHSSIHTTQIYAASNTQTQRRILATLHPRNRIKIGMPHNPIDETTKAPPVFDR
ncbi:MAG: tyrosine-type recombinase/integrase [Firmicutes bacterium]|nr:tyrosine-type recombinase/integrase [Bacillota bacterium]